MSKQNEKLKKTIADKFKNELKEKYISNGEKVNEEKVTKIFAVKTIDFEIDVEELLSSEKAHTYSIRIGFKAQCENPAGWVDKIFEFTCLVKISYVQKEQMFLIHEIGHYNPLLSTSIDWRYFEQTL